jgi:hypothetical protein
MAAAAAGLVLLVGAAAPAGAASDDESGLWWYTDAGVADAHAEATGEGVRIALMDSPVNADAPALAGANIRAGGVTECLTGEPVPVLDDGPGSQHGTDVATMLVGNGQPVNGNPGVTGVAPGAELLVYTALNSAEGVPTCVSDAEYTVSLIRDAVEQGADIIVTSSGLAIADVTATALIQAINAGVIVTAAHDNYGYVMPPGTEISTFNGLIGVEAYGPGGSRDEPVVSPSVAIVAPGETVLTYRRGDAGAWDEPQLLAGTSFASPFTGGALALAMEKWPEATSNQILQSMIHTASHANPDPVHTDEEGYGFIDVPRLLATDPTQFPDENPLIAAEGDPTPAQFEAGVYSGEFGDYPIDPPIGDGPAAEADSDEGAGGGSEGEPFPMGLVLGLLGGGVVLVGVIVLVVVLAARRKPRQPAPGPHPPQGYYGQQPQGPHPPGAYGQPAQGQYPPPPRPPQAPHGQGG